MKVGDIVRYFPVMRDRSLFSDHSVLAVYPNGIPSCREVMLSLDGKPGVVLASHCTVLKTATEERSEK